MREETYRFMEKPRSLGIKKYECRFSVRYEHQIGSRTGSLLEALHVPGDLENERGEKTQEYL